MSARRQLAELDMKVATKITNNARHLSGGCNLLTRQKPQLNLCSNQKRETTLHKTKMKLKLICHEIHSLKRLICVQLNPFRATTLWPQKTFNRRRRRNVGSVPFNCHSPLRELRLFLFQVQLAMKFKVNNQRMATIIEV